MLDVRKLATGGGPMFVASDRQPAWSGIQIRHGDQLDHPDVGVGKAVRCGRRADVRPSDGERLGDRAEAAIRLQRGLIRDLLELVAG